MSWRMNEWMNEWMNELNIYFSVDNLQNDLAHMKINMAN